jgi:hypothetical protein
MSGRRATLWHWSASRAAALGLLLALAACGGGRDIYAASSAFGDAIGRFKGGPASDAVRAYGEPTRKTTQADGRTELLWLRQGTVFRNWRFVPQDCKLTMLQGTDGNIVSVVAGGNTLYCAEQFGS